MRASTDTVARFVGVPWVSGGRDPRDGCDCWGLILAAARECFGIELPDYVGYCDADDVHEVAALFENRAAWVSIREGDERPGDVVVLKLAGTPAHAGLVVAMGLMLHSMKGRDACLERYRSLAW